VMVSRTRLSTNGHNGRGLYAGLMDPLTANIVANQSEQITLLNREVFRRFFDPRRNIDDECGYPDMETGIGTTLIDPDYYRRLYDREPIACRVVQCLPKESWQVTPLVYEDEDPDKITPFEEGWDGLSKTLRGAQSWYQDEEGSPVWEHLRRADILSGLGHYGVLLIGIDDGLAFDQPAEGVSALRPTGNAIVDKLRASKPGPEITTNRKGEPFVDMNPDEAWLAVNGITNPNRPRRKRRKEEDDQGTSVADVEEPTLNTFSRSTNYPASVSDSSPTDNLFKTSAADLGSDFSDQLGMQGTDAQYTGVQFGPSEYPSEKPAGQERKLIYLRAFDESLVQVVQYEANARNPRFGMPVIYRITLNDPREQHSGIGLPLATVRVHWSRVIHLADNLGSSEIFGVPRMRPVLNPLLDIRKVRGGAAEGYWKACITGISLETHPELGGDVNIPKQNLQDMIENYQNGLQRFLVLSGMSAKTMAPTVVDPTPHINIQIEAICIQLGIPVRVFKGSERGELASSQDDSSWNDRLRERQRGYITPRIIVPFVDRLISMGVLPEPEGYSVEWPDLDSLSDKDRAGIFLQRQQAFAAYVSGNVETVLPVKDMLTREAGFDEEEADAITDAAKDAEDTMTMPPPGELGHPATPKPPPAPPIIAPGGMPKPGQPAQKPGAPPPGGAKAPPPAPKPGAKPKLE